MFRSIFFFCLILPVTSIAQTYTDSLREHRDTYIYGHEVITGDDRKMLSFYPVSKEYRVDAKFERIYDAPWFSMPTSNNEKKTYRVYGYATFRLRDTLLKLPVYQSQQLMRVPEYADYLFIPFMDKTNGSDTYENGRYLDLRIRDINEDRLIIDFNKAYNPYCAYVSGKYSCPVPPKESFLNIHMMAGEKKFSY